MEFREKEMQYCFRYFGVVITVLRAINFRYKFGKVDFKKRRSKIKNTDLKQGDDGAQGGGQGGMGGGRGN